MKLTDRGDLREAVYAIDHTVDVINSLLQTTNNKDFVVPEKVADDLNKVVPILSKQALKVAREIGKTADKDDCCGNEGCCH